MEALRILEDKISFLINFVTELKSRNEILFTEREQLKVDCQELKTENARLTEENSQLYARLEIQEVKGNDRIQETKVVVDDLIKSIDALVRNEHQS